MYQEKEATTGCSGSILSPRRVVDEGIPASIDTPGGDSAAATCAGPTRIHLTLGEVLE